MRQLCEYSYLVGILVGVGITTLAVLAGRGLYVLLNKPESEQ